MVYISCFYIGMAIFFNDWKMTFGFVCDFVVVIHLLILDASMTDVEQRKSSAIKIALTILILGGIFICYLPLIYNWYKLPEDTRNKKFELGITDISVISIASS